MNGSAAYNLIRGRLYKERDLCVTEEAATGKQINFLTHLLMEEHHPTSDQDIRDLFADRPDEPLTKTSASAEIKTLKREI